MSDRASWLEEWCPRCRAVPGARCQRSAYWIRRPDLSAHLHHARGWRQRRCPKCKAQSGEVCRTLSGRAAAIVHAPRLSPARYELPRPEMVWAEPERAGATIRSSVSWPGRGGGPNGDNHAVPGCTTASLWTLVCARPVFPPLRRCLAPTATATTSRSTGAGLGPDCLQPHDRLGGDPLRRPPTRLGAPTQKDGHARRTFRCGLGPSFRSRRTFDGGIRWQKRAQQVLSERSERRRLRVAERVVRRARVQIRHCRLSVATPRSLMRW